MSESPRRFKVDRNSASYKLARNLARADHHLLVRLVQKRVDLGLSQAQLAEKMGVSQPTVAAFEKYDNDPKLSTIRRYAHALGVSIDHLLDGEPVITWQPPTHRETTSQHQPRGPLTVVGEVDVKTLRRMSEVLAGRSAELSVEAEFGHGNFNYTADEERAEIPVLVSAAWVN
jgi:DNA-binding XRE family transcriptional regulator